MLNSKSYYNWPVRVNHNLVKQIDEAISKVIHQKTQNIKLNYKPETENRAI